MTIWERIYTALLTLGVPVVESVYIPEAEGDYPDLYLVYFLVTAPPIFHADNSEKLRNYLVQVSVYKRVSLNNLPDVESAMVSAGFTVGVQRELPYYQPTKHFGMMFEFNYLEERN